MNLLKLETLRSAIRRRPHRDEALVARIDRRLRDGPMKMFVNPHMYPGETCRLWIFQVDGNGKALADQCTNEIAPKFQIFLSDLGPFITGTSVSVVADETGSRTQVDLQCHPLLEKCLREIAEQENLVYLPAAELDAWELSPEDVPDPGEEAWSLDYSEPTAFNMLFCE